MTAQPVVQPIVSRRYQILETLGAGGMGTVYRAQDRLTGQQVALKRVHRPAESLSFNSRSDLTSPTLALAQEFQLLASLRHPHIISVLDYGFDSDGQPYYTMDLLREPQNLIAAAKEQPIEAKVGLLAQMLQALAYLHRRGIVHRDLKPGNVMVTRANAQPDTQPDAEPIVRVLDFGLSAEADRDTTPAGTLAYMSPEVLQGRPASVASDLFAVGIMAHEMFTGQHPFQTDSINRMIEAILHSPVVLSDLSAAGIDLRIAPVIMRLLAKQPAERYPDALAVIGALSAALGQALPTETAATRESFLQAARFVGREAELDQLISALNAALDGQGSAWLIGGESGVGKSRLLDELQSRAMVRGVLALRAQAVAEGGLPYHLWRQIMARVALETELTELEAGVLKEIVTNLPTLLGRIIPDAPPLLGKAAGQRLVNVITDVFRRCDRPVLLVLEDLHWASESLEPLKLLCGQTAGLRLLVIGSYRDDEAPALPERLPDMRLLKLQRFSESAVTALSAAMLGEAGQKPQVVDLLRTETEGNAFFLVEVVRALAEEAGQLGEIGQRTLPEHVFAGGVHRILSRRLERVPEYGRAMLNVAAVAGRALELAVLQRADEAGHYLDRPLARWLTDCSDVAVLEVREGGWRFTHDRLRQTVLGQVGEVSGIHRHLAEAIEALYADDLASRAAQLAHHWQGAGDTQREAHYARMAGDHLRETGASSAALKYYERAAALLPAEPLELRYVIGQMRNLVGDLMLARDDLQTVYERAAQANDRAMMAVARSEQADVLVNMGQYDLAEERARESLDIAQSLHNREEEASALQALGGVYVSRGQYAEARPFVERSLAICRSLGRTRSLPSLLLDLCRIDSIQGAFEQASLHANEALKLAESLGNRSEIARVYNELGVISGRTGDHATSKRYYEQAFAINKLLGLKTSMAVSLVNQGIATKNLGDFAGACTLYESALALFRQSGFTMGEAVTLVNWGNALEKLDRDDEAAARWRESLRIAQQIGSAGTVAAIVKDFARLANKRSQYERAAELSALALELPALVSNNRKEAQEALETAQAHLTPEQLAAARTKAAHERLPDVIGELLSETGG